MVLVFECDLGEGLSLEPKSSKDVYSDVAHFVLQPCEVFLNQSSSQHFWMIA
jgi:hypothetical protein